MVYLLPIPTDQYFVCRLVSTKQVSIIICSLRQVPVLVWTNALINTCTTPDKVATLKKGFIITLLPVSVINDKYLCISCTLSIYVPLYLQDISSALPTKRKQKEMLLPLQSSMDFLRVQIISLSLSHTHEVKYVRVFLHGWALKSAI